MVTKVMKLLSIVVLLLTAIFWSYAPDFGLATRFIVSMGAFFVARQAGREGRYYWGVGFYAIALLFNPFLQLFTPAGKLALFAVLATAVSFAVSLSELKPNPILSMGSVSDRAPGSESL